MKERIKWIDIAKFFGIFAIYLGHFGADAQRSFPFVFTHHVALFFFISGCVENFNKEENFVRYVWKKIKTVMVPFFVFAVISAAFYIIEDNTQWPYVKALIVEILRGVVRNTFVAGSLWFLTCLFVMQILFFAIKKLKNKGLILIASIGVFLIANYVIQPHPLGSPSLYYNVDSALYYLIYYAIGYLVFPYIVQLFELDSLKKRMLFAVLAVVSLGFTVAVFFAGDVWAYIGVPVELRSLTQIFTACIIIYAYFVVSRIMEDVDALAEIGKNTLYLCGSEYIVRALLVNLFSLVGLTVTAENPLAIYIYSGLMIVVANKYLVPIEKYVINKITTISTKLF